MSQKNNMIEDSQSGVFISDEIKDIIDFDTLNEKIVLKTEVK